MPQDDVAAGAEVDRENGDQDIVLIVEDHQEVRTFIRQYLEADYAVIEAVEKNLGDEEFSVEDLSREAGMSRVQLHRKLKALMNQSAANSFSPCACSVQ